MGRLISWNTAGRTRRAAAQIAWIAERSPDVVALQEVTASSRIILRAELARIGLAQQVDTFDLGPPQGTLGPRRYGLLLASRVPWSAAALGSETMPWPERVISARQPAAHGELELFSVHVPPGSSNGWMKVEIFEGLFALLARPATGARILCGDFNSPQYELNDGSVVTWGQRLRPDGSVVVKRSIRRRAGERWDAAERSVLIGLAEHDLGDAFRGLHGYGREAFSWLARGSRPQGRRFDHMFASASLDLLGCEYLHAPRLAGLSDHSALEATFSGL